MLSIFADAMLTATRQERWDAHDHWPNHRIPHSNIQLEREAAEQRHHLYRDIGIR
ncbi:hypothetical protein ACJ5NV_12755 [Loktanella agnita]|uniref:hypothetical protein n=1 Tax=Loktanella agnita TaxID=287097 RepID=UPI0039872D07